MSLVNFLDRTFHVKEKGSTVRTEILAGLTIFFAMGYVLMVNAEMFSDGLGVPYGAIYIGTAIASIAGTLLMAFLAKMPLAQSTGMGVNAYFIYTICVKNGLTYSNALLLVLGEGLLFLILTLVGVRKMIFDAIPNVVKSIIPTGIGMFIALLGFQNSGIIVADDSTLVTLGSMNVLGDTSWHSILCILVAFISLITITILQHKNVKGACVIGIIFGTFLYYLGTLFPQELRETVHGSFTISNPFTAFKEFGEVSFVAVFKKGFDFSSCLSNHSTFELIFTIIISSLSLVMIDLFGCLGSLYGACAKGGLVDENGNIENLKKGMCCDAIATCVGAMCGTSTVTTYAESAAGTVQGGKTGLTSFVTAIMFFLCMFASPIAQLIPSCATAGVLIYVGGMMMGCVKNIEWNNIDESIPAFLTIAIMTFSFNIAYGIAFGLISHVLIKVFSGEYKKVSVTTYIITAMFLITLLVSN